MLRYLSILSLLVMLVSCQDKVICSAFQSTYILDDSTRNAYYSYVWQLDEATRSQYLAQMNGAADDSLGVVQPKTDYYAYAGEKVVPWRVRERTKYGIVKYEPYWLKKYRMRTAPMENVFAPKPLENNFVASEFSDSLSTDSLTIANTDSLGAPVAVEEPAKDEVAYLFKYDPADNFNVEQEYYNKYYGEFFVDNRPKPDPLAQQAIDSTTLVPDSLQRKKVSLKGLFKKKKIEPDTTAITPEPEPVEDSGNE